MIRRIWVERVALRELGEEKGGSNRRHLSLRGYYHTTEHATAALTVGQAQPTTTSIPAFLRLLCSLPLSPITYPRCPCPTLKCSVSVGHLFLVNCTCLRLSTYVYLPSICIEHRTRLSLMLLGLPTRPLISMVAPRSH